MKTLSIVDAAYIAGLVDGEGCISINRYKKNEEHLNYSYGLACSIGNTNLEIIEWLKFITGLGHIGIKRRSNTKHKTLYEWRLRNNEIAPFLTIISPYLRIKSQQAEWVLEFVINIRHTSMYCPLTEDEIVAKSVLFELVAELNKRGL